MRSIVTFTCDRSMRSGAKVLFDWKRISNFDWKSIYDHEPCKERAGELRATSNDQAHIEVSSLRLLPPSFDPVIL